MDNIIAQVLIAGIGVAISASIIGCFVVWRNMAYFADSLAHSSLLGIALGLVLGIDLQIAVLIIATIFALSLMVLEHQKIFAFDSLLGVLSYGFLALAVVILYMLNLDVDLHSYLFGDILAISINDIYLIYAMLLLIAVFVLYNWNALVLMTISEEIAKAEGIRVVAFKLIFMLLLALFVALATQLVGALLIGAMLIIPVVTSRIIAKSMHSMMIVSIVLNIGIFISGTLLSIYFDSPTGPSIVVVSAALFVLFLLVKNIKKYWKF
jgi:zinc transport system permease protein